MFYMFGSSSKKKVITILSVFLLMQNVMTGVAQPNNQQAGNRREKPGHHKLAKDLDDSIDKQEGKLSSLRTQAVILQLDNSVPEVTAKDGIELMGGRMKKFHNRIGLVTADVPLRRLRELSANTNIVHISPDRAVASEGHLELATAAAQVRTVINNTTLNGSGIGIAILDSGVDSAHKLLSNNSVSRVVYSKDFTGENLVGDTNGHGTHVASLAAGSSSFGTGAYAGIASGANLISLRVLNDSGAGSSSNIIAAPDWCIQNKTTYNIRVINMSLGATAVDSYQYDPLCLAARRAHDAGIVVVCAAGNDGKNSAGQKIYGAIHSPGSDPSVITVGATNTFGSDIRSDDRVASFSSHGPTRGYYTDTTGVRHYDNLIKPDLVAPGNRLIGAQAANPKSALLPNVRVQQNSVLDTNLTTDKTSKMMYMSGTSMSAPVVAGAAALLLQANPNLTPNLVKAILMYTAQPIQGANSFEQGAGQLNLDGAVRVARLVVTNPQLLAQGAVMLTAPLPVAQTSSITGETCSWGQGMVVDYCLLYGSSLMTNWQGMYAINASFPDATIIANGLIGLNSSLIASGVLNTKGAVQTSGVVLSDGVVISDGVVLGDGVILGDGVVLGDGVILGDGVVLGDSVGLGDTGTSMLPVPVN